MSESRTVLLMGVSGSGKTTIGSLLAQRSGWPFVDADNLHPATNVAKMAAGVPLTDADRRPWLQAVAERIREFRASGQSAIVACSALKRSYRDLLRAADPGLRIVYLHGDRDQLRARMAHRGGHFFPAQLLDTQLADLEEPAPDEQPLIVPIGGSPEQTVDAIQVASAG